MYFLRALDKYGAAFWYTGKAGPDWLSMYMDNAFAYTSREQARRRAMDFNKFESVHGYWFIVMSNQLDNRVEVP
jgi:hypothetical protein